MGAHLEVLPGDRLGEMLGALHGVLLEALLGLPRQVMAMHLVKSWGAP